MPLLISDARCCFDCGSVLSRHKRSRRERTDAGNRRKSLAFFIVFVPSLQALFQHINLFIDLSHLLVKQRTRLANAVRAHMAEFGIVVAQGLCNIVKLEAILSDQTDDRIPSVARDVLGLLIRPGRVFPPVECSLGVRPSHAEN